ncbi:MAG: (d)CMP kinase [Gemmatimonadota bacterium]
MSIVTVSGLPGSGTSTASRLLAERTGWQYVNAGAIFRQLAAEAGMSLPEYGARAEAQGTIDRDLDARMVELARHAAAGAILEGRLTGWMAHRHQLPALKVWLHADRQTRARRVSSRDGQSLEEALKAIDERERSEHDRYAAHHGIDISDLTIYDLTLDSAAWRPERIADEMAARLGTGQRGG